MPARKSKKSEKTFPVRVTTLDAVLDFDCQLKSTGRHLFDLVCRTLGLREIWYFGLQYTDSKGFVTWLKLHKKVLRQNIPPGIPMAFLFLVKFYAVDMAHDIIQEATRHLFFLQVKQAILKMDIHCPPETSVLLASYALQAKYGDYSGTSFPCCTIASEDLLPESTVNQFTLTSNMWLDRILVWYADHLGMTKDEAETEFLRIANDLSMFGVNYFSVFDRKKNKYWLGITPSGINKYEKHDKLCPNITLEWEDIRKISFRSRKLIIALVDRRSPSFEFYVPSVKGSKLIFDLCVGNHDIFKRKRSPESMEMQQMKLQAREEREKLLIERSKMIREKQMRVETEKEKALLEQQVKQHRDEAKFALGALHRCEMFVELLAEKAQVIAEEARLLTEKVFEVEAESRRAKICALSSEIEKNVMERKARASELLMSKTEEDSKIFKEFLIAELVKEEKKASSHCPSCSSVRNFAIAVLPQPFCQQPSDIQPGRKRIAILDDLANNEIERLKAEILNEKFEYSKRSEELLQQLQELRSELEALKDEDKAFC